MILLNSASSAGFAIRATRVRGVSVVRAEMSVREVATVLALVAGHHSSPPRRAGGSRYSSGKGTQLLER